jgi:pyruvate dehydrogenase E1 component alpha subunit
MLQLVDIDGHFLGDPDPGPDRELCRHLFSSMLYLRTFDEEVLSIQRAGRIRFCNPSTGQEASQIGSAAALSPDDWVFPSYRVAGVYLYRKGSPLALLNQLYGNAQDLSRGTQLPMHFGDRGARFLSVSSPIGTQITQAVGLSLGCRLQGEPVVAIAYFGDGATSSNDFHAALNFAGVFRTPTIFYCENNQYALSVPVSRQTASESLAAKGAAYGVPGLRIDGNDVLAVYEAVRQAAERARRGEGPTLLEAVTYRLGLHSSSDDPHLYRSSEEEEIWKPRDPVLRLRRLLDRRGWWSAAWEEEVQLGQVREIRAAILEAERQPQPEPESLFDHVYAESTPGLNAQRRLLAELRADGEGDGRIF